MRPKYSGACRRQLWWPRSPSQVAKGVARIILARPFYLQLLSCTYVRFPRLLSKSRRDMRKCGLPVDPIKAIFTPRTIWPPAARASCKIQPQSKDLALLMRLLWANKAEARYFPCFYADQAHRCWMAVSKRITPASTGAEQTKNRCQPEWTAHRHVGNRHVEAAFACRVT